MVSSPYLLKLNFRKNNSILNNNLKSTKKFSPLSGSELIYEPEKWNQPDIKNTHNC